MINQENLNKLYNAVINGSELTTKELNSYGFNSKDLADLIQQGTLKRIKRGYYAFQCVSDLYYYGKKLIAEKEYEEAFKCFNVCYELNPNDYGVCSQLFTKSLSLKDYENVFKYFDVLAHADNLYRQTDVNFYLYLLSVITDVPDKYKEYARNLNLEDISIDFSDIRYKDINDYSPIIRFSYQNASVMLTGDAETEAENDFVSKYLGEEEYLDVDVLKVGHHGSSTSSCKEFLNAVTPEICVISCGADNDYGHPHDKAVNRMLKHTEEILTTMLRIAGTG